MKTILAYAFVSVLSLSSFASIEHHPQPAPAPAPIMLGVWHSDQPLLSNGIRIHTEYHFAQAQMTMYAICQFRNPQAYITVGVASRSAYNGNLIYVYDAVDAQANDNYGRYCTASFRPSTWEFYMSATDMNRATLFAPVPYQDRIPVTRISNF